MDTIQKDCDYFIIGPPPGQVGDTFEFVFYPAFEKGRRKGVITKISDSGYAFRELPSLKADEPVIVT